MLLCSIMVILCTAPKNTPLSAIESAFGYVGYVLFLFALSAAVPLAFYVPFAFVKGPLNRIA